MEKTTQKTNYTIEDVVLNVERELLDAKTKSGEDMYCYVVRDFVVGKKLIDGKLVDCKREIRCDFVAQKDDFGGYEMLDLIFMFGDNAKLSVREESASDDNGKSMTYFTYEIWNVDADGVTYSYRVKPMKASDKSKLNVILQRAILALQKQASSESKQPDVSKKQ